MCFRLYHQCFRIHLVYLHFFQCLFLFHFSQYHYFMHWMQRYFKYHLIVDQSQQKFAIKCFYSNLLIWELVQFSYFNDFNLFSKYFFYLHFTFFSSFLFFIEYLFNFLILLANFTILINQLYLEQVRSINPITMYCLIFMQQPRMLFMFSYQIVLNLLSLYYQFNFLTQILKLINGSNHCYFTKDL